jgi:hypothetical protein
MRAKSAMTGQGTILIMPLITRTERPSWHPAPWDDQFIQLDRLSPAPASSVDI